MISHIGSIPEFNHLFISPIINENDKFLPLDQLTSDAIQNNRIDNLRLIYTSLLNQENDYNHYVEIYNSEFGPLSESIYNCSSYFGSSVLPYVYPFSRASFIEKFYSNIFPSIVNKVISYMKDTGRFHSVGTGQGKCVIVYPDPFVSDDLENLTSSYTYSQAVLATVQINSLLVSQQADINALLKQNKKLEEQVDFLLKSNEDLANARAEDYLTTWR